MKTKAGRVHDHVDTAAVMGGNTACLPVAAKLGKLAGDGRRLFRRSVGNHEVVDSGLAERQRDRPRRAAGANHQHLHAGRVMPLEAQSGNEPRPVEIVAVKRAVRVETDRVHGAGQLCRGAKRVAHGGKLHLVRDRHRHTAEIADAAKAVDDGCQIFRRGGNRHHHMVKPAFGEDRIEHHRRADMVRRIGDGSENARRAGYPRHLSAHAPLLPRLSMNCGGLRHKGPSNHHAGARIVPFSASKT